MNYRVQAEQAQKSAEQAQKNAELHLERAGILARLEEINAQLGTKTVVVTASKAADSKAAAPNASATETPKRRGRPPKSKEVTAVPVDGQPIPKRRGRPPKNPNAIAAPKGKRIELPGLLETIIQSHGKPMKHEELVVATRNAGYKSNAKDFSNMVYQCLVKLVKKGTLKKANEGKDAEYTFRAA